MVRRIFSPARSSRIEQLSRASRAPPPALASLLVAALLSGCTWFSPDAGMGLVADIAGRELKKEAAAIRSPDEAEAANAAGPRLLRRTLTADSPVQITLLNHRGPQPP